MSADLDLSQFEGMTPTAEDFEWLRKVALDGDEGAQRLAIRLVELERIVAEVKRLREESEAKTNLLVEQQSELTEVNIANATLRARVAELERDRERLTRENIELSDAIDGLKNL